MCHVPDGESVHATAARFRGPGSGSSQDGTSKGALPTLGPLTNRDRTCAATIVNDRESRVTNFGHRSRPKWSVSQLTSWLACSFVLRSRSCCEMRRRAF